MRINYPTALHTTTYYSVIISSVNFPTWRTSSVELYKLNLTLGIALYTMAYLPLSQVRLLLTPGGQVDPLFSYEYKK